MGAHGIGKIFGQPIVLEPHIIAHRLGRLPAEAEGRVRDHGIEGGLLCRVQLTQDIPVIGQSIAMEDLELGVLHPMQQHVHASEVVGRDVAFLAPKSAADFAFLLHGFHYLKDEGVMAIILPHGVLFRGGAEERIRTKLLKDGHIDTVIGLPANLFYSTGIPVCILVLKKCKKPDDVLFINAAEHFVKGKRQNQLTDEHIAKIIDSYQSRKEEERYSKRISMERIAEEGYNLNISRYISTAVGEEEIELALTHKKLA